MKGEFRTQLPTGFQSYVAQQPPSVPERRARAEALGLAIDYEWMNRQMFYNAYTRVKGIFGNTDCAPPPRCWKR